MIYSLFFYVFASSAILIYGNGLNRILFYSQSPKIGAIKCLKMLLSVVSSAALSYLFSAKLLLIADLSELYPFAAMLIFPLISVFVESIIRIASRTSSAEFALSFMSVLLALAEGSSILECMLISATGVIAFCVIIPFLSAIRKRVNASGKNARDFFLISASVAIIIIITLAWNVSWLNPKVMK